MRHKRPFFYLPAYDARHKSSLLPKKMNPSKASIRVPQSKTSSSICSIPLAHCTFMASAISLSQSLVFQALLSSPVCGKAAGSLRSWRWMYRELRMVIASFRDRRHCETKSAAATTRRSKETLLPRNAKLIGLLLPPA